MLPALKIIKYLLSKCIWVSNPSRGKRGCQKSGIIFPTTQKKRGNKTDVRDSLSADDILHIGTIILLPGMLT
jgi:hypothetical protein